MTKRIKVLLLIAITSICAAFAVAGCKTGRSSREEIISAYPGACVTYYGNGGDFNDDEIYVKEIHFAEKAASDNENAPEDGVPFYDIREKSADNKDTMTIAREGYEFIGWYEIDTHKEGAHSGELMFVDAAGEYVYKVKLSDENGNVVKDKNGNDMFVVDNTNRPMYSTEANLGDAEKYIRESAIYPVLTARQYTNADILVKGNDIQVGAYWAKLQRIEYIFCPYDAMTGEMEEGELASGEDKFKAGDVLHDAQTFGTANSKKPLSIEPKSFEGYTFVGFYLDEECTKYVSSDTDIQKPEEGDVPLYSKYVKGSWTVVKTKNDVREMFSNSDVNKKYVIAGDINCNGADIKFKSYDPSVKTEGVCGTVIGCGHKLYNLKLTTPRGTNVALAQDGSVNSILGNVKAGSIIKDIVFENVTMELATNRDYTVELYAILSGIEDGAEISNVAINGLSVKVSARNADDVLSVISNYEKGVNEGHWLFGGAESDEAFTAAHGDVIVTGAVISA